MDGNPDTHTSEAGSGSGTATAATRGTGGEIASDSGGGAGSDTTSAGSDATGAPPSACTTPDVWCPAPQTTWHWQLSGTLDTAIDAEMYDIDLFDQTADTIAGLHDDGRIVICYFSAGSHEDWRPDAADFPLAAIGDPLDGWPGEHWLDIRDAGVRDALAARLDLAVTKGCDGVEPDNVDGYANATGFDLTAEDQLTFNEWLATEAHVRGLSVGLKNDVDQIATLEPSFDWALDEECMAYDECDPLGTFIDAGKAVFHVEYVDTPADGPALHAQICPDALDRRFSTLVKQWDLDAWSMPCG